MSEEEEKPPFAEALRFLTDRERRRLADHLSPEELAGYHAGELAPEAEARIREHLALCRDCSDLLLDLVGFKKLTPPPGVAELTDEEVEEGWQAVRAKLGEGRKEEGEKVAEVVPIRSTAAAPAKSKYGVLPWKLMAAALAIVAVALGLRVIEFPKGENPQVGGEVVFDNSEVVRGSDGRDLPQMSSQDEGVFRFHFTESAAEYEGEVFSSKTREVVWIGKLTSEIRASAEGEREATFRVPAGRLDPGSYEARLIGISGERRGVIASLSFRVDGP